jgi:hypothetical protein
LPPVVAPPGSGSESVVARQVLEAEKFNLNRDFMFRVNEHQASEVTVLNLAKSRKFKLRSLSRDHLRRLLGEL